MRSSTDREGHVQPAGAWLLQQHRMFIARYARQLGRGVAEDLASEAIVRSLRHPAPDGRHGPWLERVFRNLLVDHRRGHARSRRAGWVNEDAARTDSPEQRAAEAQLRGRLAALWPELRPEWREALAASFGESDRTAQAAAGLSPTTVRTRTFRALGMLRRVLGVVRGWMPLPVGGQLQPLVAALLPAAVAVTTLVSPPPPQQRSTAPRLRAVAQVTDRPVAAPRPAAPATRPVVRPPARPRPPATGRPPQPAEPPASPRAIQRFDFDNDQVIGDLQRPDGVDVAGAPPPAGHRSLIEIPGSFAVALVRTLEDL
jgi:RNA polymerase sigma factor (sigma-70 family)